MAHNLLNEGGGLSAAYRLVCEEVRCHFFDAGGITSSNVDGVHLDLEQHLTLGNAVADVVKPGEKCALILGFEVICGNAAPQPH